MLQIDAFSDGKFSASGREGAQVAPNGKVYYKNEDVNLKVGTYNEFPTVEMRSQVAICWFCAGGTSPGCSNSATGRQEEDEGLRSIFRIFWLVVWQLFVI